jgi:hypothetical protein
MRKRNADGSYKEPVEYCSFSHVSGFRSCIVDLYKQSGVEIDAATRKLFGDFIDGYNRNIAELKQNGTMSLTEGKRPITFVGYQYIAAQALHCDCATQAPFVFSFILLCWNLMARSISVGSLMYKHILWEQDALVVYIPKHKGDQEGKRSHPKHVYANPINPGICPVLGLAVHVFSKGFQREGSSPKVYGDNSEQRFSNWLVSRVYAVYQKHGRSAWSCVHVIKINGRVYATWSIGMVTNHPNQWHLLVGFFINLRTTFM